MVNGIILLLFTAIVSMVAFVYAIRVRLQSIKQSQLPKDKFENLTIGTENRNPFDYANYDINLKMLLTSGMLAFVSIIGLITFTIKMLRK